jgi:uncharacterized Zn-finger protein
MRFFKRKRKAEDQPNPWLNIEHPHDWLEANNGEELVCGMCGKRRKNDGKSEES